MERGREIWVSGFPMFHQAGLFVSTCALAWAATQCLIPDPRNVEHIIGRDRQIQAQFHYKCSFSFPDAPWPMKKFKDLDFSGLKYCMSGAAPFPVEAVHALEKIVGRGKMVEVWGHDRNQPPDHCKIRPETLKKSVRWACPCPTPSSRWSVSSTAKRKCPWARKANSSAPPPQVMKGYLNKPKETENALRTHHGRVWMHTGDVGRMDEDGFVYVVDRAKDMLIVGGFKVLFQRSGKTNFTTTRPLPCAP